MKLKHRWRASPLGEVLAVLRNGLNCKQDKSGKGERISRIESISEASFDFGRVGYALLSERDKERYRLQPGDILFSHINSPIHVGKTALFDSHEPAYHGVNLLLMRPTSALTSEYLNHALKHLFQSGYWRSACKQSVNQASVNQGDISRIEIRFPESISEQQRVVGILDEAFDGIATAKANAEKNLQNARALFESHLQSVFTQRGEGWIQKPLGEVCSFSSGGTPSKSHDSYWHGNIPWVSGRDMKSTRLSDTALHISQEALEESSTRLAPGGALLILVRGMGLAHGAQIAELTVPCAFNQDIRAIHPVKGLLSRFLLFALRTRINYSESVLSSAAHGTLKIDLDELREVRVPVPTCIEQQHIVERIDALTRETQSLESLYRQKLVALDELKKSILHQAFSGQL